MADVADFYGYEFEAEYMLFGDEFEELPGVYIVYTSKACLEIDVTKNLKDSLETHPNTREWVKLATGDDIYIAFYIEEDEANRLEVQTHLRGKMNPFL